MARAATSGLVQLRKGTEQKHRISQTHPCEVGACLLVVLLWQGLCSVMPWLQHCYMTVPAVPAAPRCRCLSCAARSLAHLTCVLCLLESTCVARDEASSPAFPACFAEVSAAVAQSDFLRRRLGLKVRELKLMRDLHCRAEVAAPLARSLQARWCAMS